MDYHRKALIVAALVAATGAHAAPKYNCRFPSDAGHCTCNEVLPAKAEIGYSTSASETVTIVCIGDKSMSVKYFDGIPLSDLKGTYAGYSPAH